MAIPQLGSELKAIEEACPETAPRIEPLNDLHGSLTAVFNLERWVQTSLFG
jgi:hypothetical protein